MVTAARAAFHHGSVAYFLARLAATLGDHRTADELYTDAARRDERAGAAVWVARDLRRHAELLFAHDDNNRANSWRSVPPQPPKPPGSSARSS